MTDLLAGRELDALVAEKVMGLSPCRWWHWVNFGSAGGPALVANGPRFIKLPEGSSPMNIRDDLGATPEGEEECPHKGHCWPSRVADGKDEFEKFHPRYSTDIAAAWEVVEKLRNERPLPYSIEMTADDRGHDGWMVRIWLVETDDASDTYVALAESAALAICRAALEAVDQ